MTPGVLELTLSLSLSLSLSLYPCLSPFSLHHPSPPTKINAPWGSKQRQAQTNSPKAGTQQTYLDIEFDSLNHLLPLCLWDSPVRTRPPEAFLCRPDCLGSFCFEEAMAALGTVKTDLCKNRWRSGARAAPRYRLRLSRLITHDSRISATSTSSTAITTSSSYSYHQYH